jgi:hypothetical protein
MPIYRVGGMYVHIKMTNTKKRPAPAPCCARIPNPNKPSGTMHCRGISTFLCDWPVEGGTCDAPLCAEHAGQIAPETNLCPVHLVLHRRDHPELSE